MKALSLRPEWAMPVLLGEKTIECRTWQTSYRGDLLICASSRAYAGAIAGHALCVVTLEGIEPFRAAHVKPALMDFMPRGSYAWKFSEPRLIVPFAVKGKLHLYDVPDDMVKPVLEGMGKAEALHTYYEPLVKWTGRDVTERETRKWWAGVLASA